MLKNLLFTHGREAYRRNTYLIMYMFYKNIILVIPVFVFGWFSLFGGTYIYSNIFLDLYNVMITAIPIIWFAVFDWEHPKDTLLNCPKLYAIGLHDVFFNTTAFWRWFSYAVWQGILICLIVVYTFSNTAITDGQSAGLTLEGNYMFYMIVMVVNVKVLISSFEYTFWMLFWIALSLLGYYIFFMLFSFAIMSSDMYGLMQQTFVMSQNYLVLAFFVFCYIIIDEGLQMANAEVRNFLHIKRQQIERKKAQMIKKDETLEKDRISNFVNTGFAFS